MSNLPALLGPSARADEGIQTSCAFDNNFCCNSNDLPESRSTSQPCTPHAQPCHWSLHVFKCLGCLSVASWNPRSLFMGADCNAEVQKAKLRHHSRLADQYDIICIQEARGLEADLRGVEVQLEQEKRHSALEGRSELVEKMMVHNLQAELRASDERAE